MNDIETSTETFEKKSKESRNEKYILRLYISGTTPRSTQAVINVKKMCEANLSNRYILDVVDIYQQPELADKEHIIASPTLVKIYPLPLKRLIGDMSNTEKIIADLDIMGRS